MDANDTLESIASLLPADRRERFLKLCTRFQSVPEEDEYLQILEAIGFMTLLWKEVPREVENVLEGANPVTETCQSVAAKVREAVIESIPSYDDLRAISQRLESHELALKNTLAQAKRSFPKSYPTPWIPIFGASLFGVLLGWLLSKSGVIEQWFVF